MAAEYRVYSLNKQGTVPESIAHTVPVPRRSAPQSGSVLERLYLVYREKYRQEPTQRDIARIAKCDQTTVGEWGRSALPRGDLGIKLAQAFNLTLDWLYLGRGPRNPDAVLESPFAKAVEILARSWSEEERARTLQYLMEKDQFLRNASNASIEDLLRQIASQDPKPRKPS